jgi:hypothetical protein
VIIFTRRQAIQRFDKRSEINFSKVHVLVLLGSECDLKPIGEI